MAYSPEVYKSANEALEARRSNAEHLAAKKKSELYEKIPKLAEIDSILANNMVSLCGLAIRGGGESSEKAFSDMKASCEKAEREKTELLKKNGYSPDYLEPEYCCKKCGDTGRVNGVLCSCYKELCVDKALAELEKSSDSGLCSFENFKISYYPDNGASDMSNPREKMALLLNSFKKYAEEFTPDSKSLLLLGKTGLGKTHISLAIAKEVIKKGYGVTYCPAQHLCSVLENEHFSKGSGDEDLRKLCECDMLIIDDLGAEFSTSFNVSAIGNLINERLFLKKPTIISSNLTAEEIKDRYSERTASRLLFEYAVTSFSGNDVRNIIKNEKKGAV